MDTFQGVGVEDLSIFTAAAAAEEQTQEDDPLDSMLDLALATATTAHTAAATSPPVSATPPRDHKKRRKNDPLQGVPTLTSLWPAAAGASPAAAPAAIKSEGEEPETDSTPPSDEQPTFRIPPRFPNAPCNRLGQVKADEMFPEEMNLRLLAECQLDNDDEEPVCGACLSDLFPEEEEEEEEDEEATPPPQQLTEAAARRVVVGGRAMTVTNEGPLTAEDFSVVDASLEVIGLVSSCLHMFHAECVGKWTATENSCPQCKQRYGMIAYYSTSGRRQRKIPVKKRLQSLARRLEEAEGSGGADVCDFCSQVGDFASQIKCSEPGGCDSRAHFYCLNMERMPDTWLCPEHAGCESVAENFTVPVPQPSRARRSNAASRRGIAAVLIAEARVQYLEAQQRREQIARLQEGGSSLLERTAEEVLDDDYSFIHSGDSRQSRLLPSEQAESDQAVKSNITDLLLGSVPIHELQGGPSTPPGRRRPSTRPSPPQVPAVTRPAASRPHVPVMSVSTTATSAPKGGRLSALDAALASVAEVASRALSRSGVSVPSGELVATKSTTAAPRPHAVRQRSPSPTRRPAPALTIEPQFIESVSSSTNGNGISTMSGQKGRQAIRVKSGPVPQLGRKMPTLPIITSSSGPGRVRTSVQLDREMRDVVASMLDQQLSFIFEDCGALNRGNPAGILRARDVLIRKLCHDCVNPTLPVRLQGLPLDEKIRQFRQACERVVLPAIRKHPLAINSTTRRRYLQQKLSAKLDGSDSD